MLELCSFFPELSIIIGKFFGFPKRLIFLLKKETRLASPPVPSGIHLAD